MRSVFFGGGFLGVDLIDFDLVLSNLDDDIDSFLDG